MKNVDKPDEKFVLKFREVYESPEWKELDTIDRAQLMLVAEGVKPGTIIGGNFTNFPKILKKLGLESSLNTHPYCLEPVYMVAKAEKLAEYFKELIATPINANHNFFHRLNGKFLGYPECCTEEYCNPQKNLGARQAISPNRFISNVDYELDQEINATGTYPEELDYCPPSFTPCSVHCAEALGRLKQWGEVIKNSDSEAARELQIFNWFDSPRMKIHVEELGELKNKEELKWRIEELRKSFSKL